MMNTMEERKGRPDFGCCNPMMHGPRSCGLGFGIVLILIGAIWLAAETGWIAPDLFWPAVFLAAGVVVLILNLAKVGRIRSDGKQGGVM